MSNVITQEFNIDTSLSANNPIVRVSQYDDGLRVLKFNIVTNNIAYEFAPDDVVYIQGKKNGVTLFRLKLEKEGHKAICNVCFAMTEFSGDITCSLVVTNTEEFNGDAKSIRFETADFILRVKASTLDEGSNIPEGYVIATQEMIKEFSEAGITANFVDRINKFLPDQDAGVDGNILVRTGTGSKWVEREPRLSVETNDQITISVSEGTLKIVFAQLTSGLGIYAVSRREENGNIVVLPIVDNDNVLFSIIDADNAVGFDAIYECNYRIIDLT